MRIWKRLIHWRRRGQFELDLAEEMRIHREMAEAYEPGRSREFGSVALALEDSRAAWSFQWLESLRQDVRYALRCLRKSPAFALAVIGTIGAALGLNTTVFTVINAYALRPVHVQDPYSLYRFTWIAKSGFHNFSPTEYEALRARKMPFHDVLAVRNFLGTLEGFSLLGQPVSDNYFSMLGVAMYQGRPLVPGDSAALVLGYEAWKNKFGADPNMIGRKLYMHGQPFEVVGIASSQFHGLESIPTGFWMPMKMAASTTFLSDRFWLIGRLQPGVSLDAAKDSLLAWSRAMTASLPESKQARSVELKSQATNIPMDRVTLAAFIPVFVAFALVLLTACANVSNMMLARALARQREIGIRISLGAGRARLVRQLLTESAMLAIPAAIAGLAVSEITIRLAQRLLFSTVPAAFARILTLEDLTPDWRVFGFIFAAAVAATLVFGLIPALQTTHSRLVQANRGDFGNDLRPQRLRNALIVAQAAVCALLLICTGIVVRTQQKVAVIETGLDLPGVYDVRMLAKYQAAAAERLAREPGVEAVAPVWRAPLYGTLRHIPVTAAGSTATLGIGANYVAPEYFAVFRLPLRSGRLFTRAEAAGNAAVAVISESAARRLWPDGEALGRMIEILPRAVGDADFDRAPPFRSAMVVGTVRDVNAGMLAEGPDPATIYFPTAPRSLLNDSLLVRVRGDAAGMRRRIEAALNEVAPSIADMINPMDDVLAIQLYPFRVIFWVAGFLGGFALLLTVSGIYGVLCYLVNQRTREIGIRVALGAGTAEVVGMVVKQSSKLALFGAGLGIAAALGVAPLMANQLTALQPYDAAAYAGAAAVVILAMLAASWHPARRAMAVDPATALKCD